MNNDLFRLVHPVSEQGLVEALRDPHLLEVKRVDAEVDLSGFDAALELLLAVVPVRHRNPRAPPRHPPVSPPADGDREALPRAPVHSPDARAGTDRCSSNDLFRLVHPVSEQGLVEALRDPHLLEVKQVDAEVELSGFDAALEQLLAVVPVRHRNPRDPPRRPPVSPPADGDREALPQAPAHSPDALAGTDRCSCRLRFDGRLSLCRWVNLLGIGHCLGKCH